jgi:hypothetical protein
MISENEEIFNLDDDFCFGFSTVSESELKAYEHTLQQTVTQTAELHAEAEERFDRLYKMIMPLLINLKADPEKAYILWPDRVKKIDAFIKKIQAIKETK